MSSPTIDSGSIVSSTTVGTNSVVINLTTAGPNEVAVLCVGWETAFSPAQTIVSVTASGLTFTKRSGAVNVGQQNESVELWYAPCALQQTAVPITVTFSGNFDDCCTGVFGVIGCGDITAPFDPNVAASAVANTGGPPSPATTTTNPDDLIIGCYGRVSGSGYGPTSGWTNVISQHTSAGTLAQGTFVDVQSVSSPQTAFAYVPGAGDQGVSLVDAFTANGAGPPPGPSAFNRTFPISINSRAIPLRDHRSFPVE